MRLGSEEADVPATITQRDIDGHPPDHPGSTHTRTNFRSTTEARSIEARRERA